MNWDQRKLLAVFGLLLILAFAGGVTYAGMRKAPADAEKTLLDQPAVDGESPVQKEQSQNIEVYITGEVNKPGVYQVKTGDRVHEALDLAQPTEEANLKVINLARKLQDEEAIVVPSIHDAALNTPAMQEGQSLDTSGGIHAEDAAQGKVNINTASVQELDEKLSGIGPTLAGRIVDYRNSNGGFQQIEDLMQVSGIGEKRFADLKDSVSVR